MKFHRQLPFLLLPLAALVPQASACSVCGCTLSSDWAAQGYPTIPGLEAGLRFEYSDQTDLRQGTHSFDRSSVTFPTDDEIQQETLNRAIWLDLNYGLSRTWAVAVSVPEFNRFHTTIAEGDTEISTSHARGLGDVRVVGRYQVTSPTSSFGFQFGLKLPTGRIDQTFDSGPQAGELVDRGLQLGTGTTDTLLGVSWFTRPEPTLGCFFQTTLDVPLAAREDFRPSDSLNVSAGVRWLNSSSLTPNLQVNAKFEDREHGDEADTPNSGGVQVYLSPGVTAQLGHSSSAFVFVQLPLYQRLNGLQLEPRWVLSVGTRWRW